MFSAPPIPRLFIAKTIFLRIISIEKFIQMFLSLLSLAIQYLLEIVQGYRFSNLCSSYDRQNVNRVHVEQNTQSYIYTRHVPIQIKLRNHVQNLEGYRKKDYFFHLTPHQPTGQMIWNFFLYPQPHPRYYP